MKFKINYQVAEYEDVYNIEAVNAQTALTVFYIGADFHRTSVVDRKIKPTKTVKRVKVDTNAFYYLASRKQLLKEFCKINQKQRDLRIIEKLEPKILSIKSVTF